MPNKKRPHTRKAEQLRRAETPPAPQGPTASIPFPSDCGRRVVISDVKPEINEGRFPIKRIQGERVVVEASVFADGHEVLTCRLMVRRDSESRWEELSMIALGNDRWQGEFTVSNLEPYRYCVAALIDPFLTWRRDLVKRIEAKQDVSVELQIGGELVEAAAGRAAGEESERLQLLAKTLRSSGRSAAGTELALGDELSTLMARHADRTHETVYPRELRVHVDRPKARYSTWYEMFPRSCGEKGDRHGTFRDCEARLDYLAYMGFDVLYLPPIHPIGRRFRKGPNNNPDSGPDAIGSPWGIGAAEGGHTAIHPELGTLNDFQRLVAAANKQGIEIALDIAWQCSPDHLYVKEHPDWFRKRPDGTIQYAENPPKKYQDIYPLHFDTKDWKALWKELRSVVEYWIEQGIRIFRVDNPHTKPFAFWEWLIQDVQGVHPEVLFLAEAFTRPKVMYELAKRGFSQSYTYFAWRNKKWELRQYFTELTRTEVSEFFRPNLWPNTPDILTEYLQSGGRPAFVIRFILAATLGASYGIYGPAFELCEHRPRESGSEEYLNSEKYEIRRWNLDAGHSLKEIIARVNRIRRTHPALQSDGSLVFHETDNDQLIVYSKAAPEADDLLITVVNLDPRHVQSGWISLNLEAIGIKPDSALQVHDLLSDRWFSWQGERNFVQLDPQVMPAHILRVQGRPRTGQDFEQYP